MRNKRDGRIRIAVTSDEMAAIAVISPPVGKGDPVTSRQLKAALREAVIVYGVMDDFKMTDALRRATRSEVTIVAAYGRVPGAGGDAKLECLWDVKDFRLCADEATRVNYRELGTSASVYKGMVIARKKDPEQGEHGLTVTGKIIPGGFGRDRAFSGGQNVQAIKGGTEFISDIDGMPRLRDDTLSVEPVFRVDGDVNYAVGNIEYCGTVVIKGSVLDGFMVKAEGDVVIGGHVDAATVIAGGDIRVDGGIITRYGGYVAAEGRIFARIITNSIVEAEGDVIAIKEIVNSFIRSNGAVECVGGEGRVTGGDVMARRGIIAGRIGSVKETPTTIRLGFNFRNYLFATELGQEVGMVKSELREIGKSLARCAPASEKAIIMKERARLLNKDRVRLEKEIDALKKAAPVNNGATLRCSEIMAGTALFIGDSSRRISTGIRRATIFLDQELAIQVQTPMMSYTGFEAPKQAVSSSDAGMDEYEVPCKYYGGDKRVILMDASMLSRRRLKRILENSGYVVAGEASDADDFKELCRSMMPEIAIVDILTAGSESMEILSALSEIHPGITILSAAGPAGTTGIREAVRSGSAGFILRPYSRKQVVETIYRAVTHGKAMEADAV